MFRTCCGEASWRNRAFTLSWPDQFKKEFNVRKNKNSVGRWLGYGCIGLIAMVSSCNTKDPCNIPCHNGTCVNSSCTCDLGFEGDSCSVLSTYKFIGSWDALDSCETNNYAYTATIAGSSSIVNQIIITNFGRYGTSFTVKAEVSGMTFTVPEQHVEGITLSGNGVIDTVTNKITVSFSVRDEFFQTDACTGVWTKVE